MESWEEYVEVVYYADWITPAEMWYVLPFKGVAMQGLKEHSLNCYAGINDTLGCPNDCVEVDNLLWTQLPFMDSDYEEVDMCLWNILPFHDSEEGEDVPVPVGLFDLVDMMGLDMEDNPISNQDVFLEQIGGTGCDENSDKVYKIDDRTSDQSLVLDEIGDAHCDDDNNKVFDKIANPTSDQDTALDEIGNTGCDENIEKVVDGIGHLTSDQNAVLDEIGDSVCIEEGGHLGNNVAKGSSSPLPKSLFSVKRGSSGKYFLEYEYTGERSVEGSGQIVYKNGTFKINAAANMEIGKSATLIFQAGEVQVVIDISNEPKEVIQQKMKWLRMKELKKTVGPAQEPVPGTYYGARVVEQERLALQSSFIKCPVQTTLKLKLNLSLSKMNLTRTVKFSYGGIEVYLLITNMGPLFKPIVTKKLSRKLNIPPSDLWTSHYSVSFQEEPKSEIEAVSSSTSSSTVKPLSYWGRLRRMFCSSKVRPMMEQ